MKHNANNRRISALARLKASTFFPKKERTEEQWNAWKSKQIKILEDRIQ